MAPTSESELLARLAQLTAAPPGSKVDWAEWEAIVQTLVEITHVQAAPCERMAKKNPQKRLDHLHSLLVAGGALLGPVKFAHGSDQSGNLVQAQLPVRKGALLAKIPRKFAVAAPKVDPTATDGPLALFSRSPVLRARADVALAFTLWALRNDARLSPALLGLDGAILDAYWAVLPTSFDLPLCCSWDELLLLRGLPFAYQAFAQFKIWARLYLLLRQELAADAHYAAVLPRWTWSSFGWAVCAVLSRANSLETSPGVSTLVMLPGIDLFNHHVVAPGKDECGNLAFDSSADAFSVVALAAADPGEQLCMLYGPRRSAEDLFLNMGFVPDGPVQTRVLLQLTAGAAQPRRLESLRAAGFSNPAMLDLDPVELRTAPTRSRVFAYLRIKLASDAELEDGATGAHLDAKAAQFLELRLRAMLAAATSAHAVLSGISATGWRVLCIRRLAQLELDGLSAALDAVKEF